MRDGSSQVRAPGRRGARARRARAVARAAVLLLVALLLAPACAAPGSDLALAPLFERTSTADGRTELEAAAGLWRQRWDAATGRFESLTVGPIYSLDRVSPERRRSSGPDALPAKGDDGDWLSRYLVPLGFTSHRDRRTTSLLIPFYLWRSYERANGTRERDLYTILGLIVRANAERGTEVSWFPFYGRLDDIFTYDRIVFILWPLFVYAERGGKVSYHVPWPLIGWTRGGGEKSDHLFPLYTHAKVEGRYDRWAFLWPFFHWQRNHLDTPEPESDWWVFPLIGHTARGTYRSTSVLWPFFGWASDPDTGFWAWDGPWPLVRLQHGPGDVRRWRFWPLFGYLHSQGLTARTFLWPLIHLRHEEDGEAVRDSTWILPVWQSWDRRARVEGDPPGEASGQTAAWRKLFPLFQWERDGGWSRGSFPTLDPLWRSEIVDRHYAWMWKLFEWEVDRDAGTRRERSLAGLWKREHDRDEDRVYLSFLWSRRRHQEAGKRVTEHSLLFGLLRWRVTEGEGFDILRPAFPGPGWPARASEHGTPHPDPGDTPAAAADAQGT